MQALRDYVTAADGYRYANQVSLLHCKIQVLTGCPSQRQAALDLGNSAGCEHIAAGRHTLQSDSEMAWPCFRQQHDSTALGVRKHQKARMLEFLATTNCKVIEMQNVQHDAVTCHRLSPSKGWPSQREAGALGPWALGILEAELGHHRAPSFIAGIAGQVIPSILRLYFHGGTPAQHQDSFRRCQLVKAMADMIAIFQYISRYFNMLQMLQWTAGLIELSALDQIDWYGVNVNAGALLETRRWRHLVPLGRCLSCCRPYDKLLTDIYYITDINCINSWQFSGQGHFRLNTHHTTCTFTMYG